MAQLLADSLLEFHLTVLREIFGGSSYQDIKEKFSDKFNDLNYEEIAVSNNLLTFDNDGVLIGAYPVSPSKTPFKVTIDSIGTSYCMCAIDALGIPYTFNKKTTINAQDKSTNRDVTIEIDPITEKVKKDFSGDLFVTYKDPDKVCNIAQDQCPVINFYSDKQSIPIDKDLIIFSFNEALAHAKNIFSQDAIKKNFFNGFKAIAKEDL